MASKYLQKFPVPDDFRQILHDFTREILRVQPEDIIDFAEQYFEHQKDHPNGDDKDWDSKYNIKQKDQQNKQEYQPAPYNQISNNAKRVVDISNDRPVESKPPKPVSDPAAKRPPSGLDHATKDQRQAPSNVRNERADSGQSDKGNTSHISHNSGVSSGSHPEEKKITKQFIGGLYDSAINKVMTPIETDENKPLTSDKLGRDTRGVVLDGPQEEYDMAARQIQGNFKKKKTMAEEREIKTKAREMKLKQKENMKQSNGQAVEQSPGKQEEEFQGGEGQEEMQQRIIEGNYQEEGGQEMEEGYQGQDGEEYEGEGGEEYEGEGGFNREQLMNLAAQAFASCDTDGSGFIERGEFMTLLSDIASEMGIPKPEPELVIQILNELDQNKDGKLSLEEFSVLVEQVLMAFINSLNDGGEEAEEN